MPPPRVYSINLSIPLITAPVPTTAPQPVTEKVTWTNATGGMCYVFKGWIWIGESGGSVADTPFQLDNLTQGENYLSLGWDHYENPTGINANSLSFDVTPGAFYVFPNDVIQFQVGMVNYNTSVAYGSAGCKLYYTLT